jgi:outer membrane protein assembly factor BamD
MINMFPDSTLIPRAKQRLREVQEVEAQREFEIGSFYSSHDNWAATIARLQTVADTYPLFSHSDMTLIELGDAYSAQARLAGSWQVNIKPEARAQLVKVYSDRAAQAYARVVTRYPMAPHVEDAKDRLIAMNYPVPEPSREQLAESEAEEGSLSNIKLKDRAFSLIKHGPTIVQAARVGEPTLADPPPVLAPAVQKQSIEAFNAAVLGKPVGGGAAPTTAASNGTPNAAPRSDQPAAAPSFEDVPAAGTSSSATTTSETTPSTTPSSGTGLGAEIINSPARTGGTDAGGAGPYTGAPRSSPGDGSGNGADALPTPGVQPAADPAAAAGGMKAVGPANSQPLAPVEKPAPANAQINDVKSGNAQVNTATTSGANKKTKPKYDSGKESSSRHKKKKGIDKINPF